MTREELKYYLAGIAPADHDMIRRITDYQMALAKPPGSLGELEVISERLGGITGRLHNKIEKTRIIVLCADNGVTAEGVSVTPTAVTAAQAVNMTRGLTGMSAIAFAFGCEVQPVDVGIATPYDCDGVLKRVVNPKGTRNLYREAAMTEAECLEALAVGIEMAEKAADDGIDAVGVGEMGIGNTTTSSAILSVLTGLKAEQVTGRGGGLSDEAFLKKKAVVEGAVRRLQPDPEDPLDVLTKVGGLDIAAMCGVYLGCARRRVPVVIDGFISIVAALAAARLCPEARDYMFPSHASYEIGYKAAAEELGLTPYLLLGMRLGEGSGCPIAFQVMKAACAVVNGMQTFSDADINDDYLTDIRKKDSFTV